MFPACEISRRRRRIFYEAVNVQRNALRRQLAGEAADQVVGDRQRGRQVQHAVAPTPGSIDTAAVAISP